ncbi:MAG: Type 3 secretion system secretin [Chlamydiia bacterium]|nr:Type 3 secretion system secretin [Chlamydiia bacterium]MCH9615492.1 Type 3 secretion system secretin [Chlamydiia bacterium]MCH9629147.1 Type 3 secretion system secretin [Chlamydiia bacterium]
MQKMDTLKTGFIAIIAVSFMRKLVLSLLLLSNAAIFGQSSYTVPMSVKSAGYTINFQDVKMAELVRFVSKIAETPFIFDDRELDFNVSISSGKEISEAEVLSLLFHLLYKNNVKVQERNGYYYLERKVPKTALIKSTNRENSRSKPSSGKKNEDEFTVYKLQYHMGEGIMTALKSSNLGKAKDLDEAIKSMQWIEQTNSLLLSGTPAAVEKLEGIIHTLDQPQKQVFIEVLVVETNVKNGLEFGIKWGAGGKVKDRLGFATGSIDGEFAKTYKGINATNTPQGPSQIPLGRGFDLGVIGDIILHRGKTFFSLASLISALETDKDSKIILNQKIITQDGKMSRIFVGDNIPFTGSVVETVGAAQQTTSNIEYRDVGVSLTITPLLGNEDVITLDIAEEITEAEREQINGGIRTRKTNMATRAHVPDDSFLVLSGMTKDKKVKHKSGVPCLGSIPWIGALFSETRTDVEKRNIMIFVRPRIVDNQEAYKAVSDEYYSQIP